jgi:hypothetical protein
MISLMGTQWIPSDFYFEKSGCLYILPIFKLNSNKLLRSSIFLFKFL